MKSLRIVERVASGITLLFVWTYFSSSPAVAQPLCVCDCNDDGVCMIDELVLGVNIGLGIASVTECTAFDANGDGYVHINEVMLAVISALEVCPNAPQACGGPLDVACPAGEFCEFPEGTCDDPEQIGACIEVPDGCPEILAPVCGCDGVIYDNDCLRQVAGVSKDMDGDCSAPLVLTVTKTEDTKDGVCDEDCSLREAIVAANAEPGRAEVKVPEGTYVLLLGSLEITDGLVLAGAGAEATVIDGNAAVRVFRVFREMTETSFTLRNLTISNGEAVAGAAILSDRGGTLNVSHCTFSGNHATSRGGAIWSQDQLVIDNSTFEGNSSADRGGAIAIVEGTATVTDSTFEDNSSEGDGGAIWSLEQLTVDNSTFEGNSSEGDGGAIAIGGTATVTDSTFEGNSSAGSGGGIAIFWGEVSLVDSTLRGNTADTGGGIYVRGQKMEVTLTNCTISGNTADTGGGIVLINACDNRCGVPNMILTNSTVENIISVDADLALRNTIISSSASGSNCMYYNYGSIRLTAISLGHNLDTDGSCGLTGEGDLSGVDAHLAPLGDYGGPTDTHALCTGPGMPHPDCMAASPALDAGDNDACPDTDQRGVERPQPLGGVCDIGAYEAE